MTDEVFKKEVEDLTSMLNDLHRIRDKSRTKWLKREIRVQVARILKDY